MLDSVKFQRRQSEIRQALAGLVGKETPTEDETRSMDTLDKEYRLNETRYRAALIAEDGERRDAGAELETRTDRQFADLISHFELRQIALALDEGRALTGQTAEVVQELRAQGGFQGMPVPWMALERRAGENHRLGCSESAANPPGHRPPVSGIGGGADGGANDHHRLWLDRMAGGHVIGDGGLGHDRNWQRGRADRLCHDRQGDDAQQHPGHSDAHHAPDAETGRGSHRGGHSARYQRRYGTGAGQGDFSRGRCVG